MQITNKSSHSNTPLSRWAMYINKALLAHILLERSRIHGLSKHIGKLTSRRNMRQENEAFMNLDSNQMTIHFNVLCSLMKRRILCKLNCRFIIRKSAKRNKNRDEDHHKDTLSRNYQEKHNSQ